MNMLPTCLSPHYVYACCLCRPEEGIESPAGTVVVNHRVGTRNQTHFQTASTLNHWSIAPAP